MEGELICLCTFWCLSTPDLLTLWHYGQSVKNVRIYHIVSHSVQSNISREKNCRGRRACIASINFTSNLEIIPTSLAFTYVWQYKHVAKLESTYMRCGNIRMWQHWSLRVWNGLSRFSLGIEYPIYNFHTHNLCWNWVSIPSKVLERYASIHSTISPCVLNLLQLLAT